MERIGSFIPQSAIRQQAEANRKQFGHELAANKCERCLKGHDGRVDGAYVWKEEDEESVRVMYICPHRMECEKLLAFKAGYQDRLTKRSGMSDELLKKTVSGFKADSPHQKAMKAMAAGYVTRCIEDYKLFNKPFWLFLGGQSGSGKTHLCAAAVNEFMRRGRGVRYCAYTELTRALSNFDYQLEAEIKNAKILFLDDLFKVDPTAGELKSIFDIIDYRYRQNLQTIISSEKELDEIEQIDAAVAGRIMERCGKFFMGIERDDRKNFRKERNRC